MQHYCLATAVDAAPQSIPRGFDGKYDWPVIDDTEKAKRGWVKWEPPVHDVNYQAVETTFDQDAETGEWVATYTIVERDDVDNVRSWLLDRLAERRWNEQVKGVDVELNGETHRFHSDAEGRGNLGDKLQLAREYEALNGEGSYQAAWKAMDAFVQVGVADLMTIGFAIGSYIDGCFAREQAIIAILNATTEVSILMNAFDAEIDQGWP